MKRAKVAEGERVKKERKEGAQKESRRRQRREISSVSASALV